jgi:hypothetical protein
VALTRSVAPLQRADEKSKMEIAIVLILALILIVIVMAIFGKMTRSVLKEGVFSYTRKCPHCRESINGHASHCPHCTQPTGWA